MTDEERRRRIDEVCDGALARNTDERAAFIAAECGADAALRREVEELLAHAQTAERFLAMPVAAVTAHVLGDTDGASMVGRQLASYTIGSRLGAGGMGEVYRARDTKLGRDVAIKILPHAFTNDPERLQRFAREARLLATVNHPHIGAIYALEDIDGIRALVLIWKDRCQRAGSFLIVRSKTSPHPACPAIRVRALSVPQSSDRPSGNDDESL